MISVVDNLINQSKKALTEIDYHKCMIAEGDKILETLNPKYAAEKEQAQTIMQLKNGYDDISKKFSKIEADNAKMMSMLQQLTSAKSSKS